MLSHSKNILVVDETHGTNTNQYDYNLLNMVVVSLKQLRKNVQI
jgi:hypothetical protein